MANPASQKSYAGPQYCLLLWVGRFNFIVNVFKFNDRHENIKFLWKAKGQSEKYVIQKKILLAPPPSNTSLCFFLNPPLTPQKKWQALSGKEKKFGANVRYIKICLFLHQILHLDRKKYHEINSLKIFRLIITFRWDCRKK